MPESVRREGTSVIAPRVAGTIARMDIVHPQVEDYMRSLLARYDEPVLLEMEAEGAERNFPIIGRLVGATVELLARSVGAKRVFELGSGYGYSAYWFSRAVGPGGEVHCTDGDPANESKALDYLGRAGLGETDPVARRGRGDRLVARSRASSTSSTTTSTRTATRTPGGRPASGSASGACTSATTCCGRAASRSTTPTTHDPRTRRRSSSTTA